MRRAISGVVLSVLVLSGPSARGQTTVSPESEGEAAPTEGARPEDLEPSEGLLLWVRYCPHVTQGGLRELLLLELATLGKDTLAAPVEIRVDCVSDALIISVESRARPPLTRRLVGDPQAVSERKVSLVASELVADLWAPEEPERENDGPPKSAPGRQQQGPSAPAEARLFVGAGGGVVRWESPGRLSPAAVLAIGFIPSRHIELGAWMSWGTSRVFTEVAEVRQTVGSVDAFLHGVMPLQEFSLFAGAGLPVGWVQMRPRSLVPGAREDRLLAPWAALVGEGGARWRVKERWHLFAMGFGGAVLLPVSGTVEGEPLVQVAGWMMGARAGLGLSFR